MIVCPYQTYRYRRGCTLIVPHLHWPRWRAVAVSGLDVIGLRMLADWWPRRARLGQ
jgi:hypothetical protein